MNISAAKLRPAGLVIAVPAALAPVLAISSASFGTWSSWWLCAVWLAAALTAMFTAPATAEP